MPEEKQGCEDLCHRQVLSELLGTFILVFCGTAAVAVNSLSSGALGHVGICLVFGLVVTAMIYAVGDVSGAHLNPAVTLAFYVSRRLRLRCVFPYIAAQIAGAVTASLLVKLLFSNAGTLGETLPAGWINIGGAFALELVMSFILMSVILNVSTGAMEKGIMAGVAVGGTVGLLALLGGPATGASMNPARSLGPALISGQIQYLWLYMAAPLAGTLLAVMVCGLLRKKDGFTSCET